MTVTAIQSRLTRWHASGIHLLISAAIAGAALCVMLLVWYPRPLFEACGGTGLLFILVGVDVVIGPLITLIIFKIGKKGLRFDLCAIAVLQLSALLYGCYVLFQARPVYLVLIKDQFEVVTAVELTRDQLALARHAEYRTLPVGGPVLVYSDPPAEDRQEIITSVLSGGPDIQHRPKFYVPYAERRKEALANAHPLDHARKAWPDSVPIIEKFLAESGRRPDEVVYLAGRAPYGWIIGLVDARTGDLLRFLFVSHA